MDIIKELRGLVEPPVEWVELLARFEQGASKYIVYAKVRTLHLDEWAGIVSVEETEANLMAALVQKITDTINADAVAARKSKGKPE